MPCVFSWQHFQEGFESQSQKRPRPQYCIEVCPRPKSSGKSNCLTTNSIAADKNAAQKSRVRAKSLHGAQYGVSNTTIRPKEMPEASQKSIRSSAVSRDFIPPKSRNLLNKAAPCKVSERCWLIKRLLRNVLPQPSLPSEKLFGCR